MELQLMRSYHARGTNGNLLYRGMVVCHTIELPWKDNARNISCIPEGRYTLERRHSEKFGWHLHVQGVSDRSLILLHPANDALRELQGCIAPVSLLTGEGKGEESRKAMAALLQLCSGAFSREEPVYLTIQQQSV
ncbi:MAG: hypothetical protein KGO81_15160 [Bacteroidota bacterium]|nr:hypothetical protein [Bacteroidota bacterium]